MELLDLAEYGASLIRFPKKPPAKNHPWRKNLKDWQKKQWDRQTNERNSRWLNDWKPQKYQTVMWTNDFYSVDQKQEFKIKEKYI